jgi:hypothetical protein
MEDRENNYIISIFDNFVYTNFYKLKRSIELLRMNSSLTFIINIANIDYNHKTSTYAIIDDKKYFWTYSWTYSPYEHNLVNYIPITIKVIDKVNDTINTLDRNVYRY